MTCGGDSYSVPENIGDVWLQKMLLSFRERCRRSCRSHSLSHKSHIQLLDYLSCYLEHLVWIISFPWIKKRKYSTWKENISDARLDDSSPPAPRPVRSVWLHRCVVPSRRMRVAHCCDRLLRWWMSSDSDREAWSEQTGWQPDGGRDVVFDLTSVELEQTSSALRRTPEERPPWRFERFLFLTAC